MEKMRNRDEEQAKRERSERNCYHVGFPRRVAPWRVARGVATMHVHG